MSELVKPGELALVVEDDEDLAIIFTAALQDSNYHVETIRDGLSAQRRLLQVESHLVILDMHIPYLSGAEILQQIRADVRLKRTTVVITTADAHLGEMFTDIADFYADQTVLIYTTARPDRQVAQAIGDRGRAELINKKYPAGF